MQQCSLVLLFVAGCGRLDFGVQDDAAPAGAGISDGSVGTGSIACADVQLGSALGSAVASGTTVGKVQRYDRVCHDGGAGGAGPDVTFGWTAPATATYQIDLCGSPPGFDSTLTVYNGSCTGQQLSCNDDGCGIALAPSKLSVALTAGQTVVIVVDGWTASDQGAFQLAITQK
jgi:hypothetical protein